VRVKSGYYKKTLNYSLDSSKIRSQDTYAVITRVAANIYGEQLAWNFLRDNYDTIYNRYGNDIGRSKQIVGTVIINFNTQRQYDEVTSFFANRPLGTFAPSYYQSLEKIRLNIEWLSKNYQPVISFLSSL